MKVLQGSIIFVLIVVIVIISYNIFYNDRINITLDKCIDGDTASFIIDGKRQKVRFLGIDTPESIGTIEEYGELSSDYTCNKLKGSKNIYLELDFNSDKYDKYDRLLGYVFVDGKNLNELLLLEGLAEVKYIYGEYKYIDNFCDSQYMAYNKKLNIWNIYDYKNNYCNGVNDN